MINGVFIRDINIFHMKRLIQMRSITWKHLKEALEYRSSLSRLGHCLAVARGGLNDVVSVVKSAIFVMVFCCFLV